MRRFNGALLLVLAVSGGFAVGTACAQATSEPVVTRDTSFRIPFTVDQKDKPRLREVQLYFSRDRGARWRLYTSTRPDQVDFTFTAPSDGEYWFSVRTMDLEGRIYPPSLDGVAPGLRVVVDTTPPEVALRGSNPPGDQVGVSWGVIDDNLDLNTLRLEYRGGGSTEWYPVNVERTREGRTTWSPSVRGAVDIRLRVADRAGNEGARTITLAAPAGIPAFSTNANATQRRPERQTQPLQSGGYQIPGRPAFGSAQQSPTVLQNPAVQQRPYPQFNPSQQTTQRSEPAPLNTRLVNSTVFDIAYEIESQGKSGLSSVTLYYTYDGRRWELWGEDEDRASPFLVEVNGEGVYGFTLVARNGAGVGDDAPSPGSPPQAWIEVDITPPEIELHPPRPGQGAAEGILDIAWQVQDRNLEAKSITLEYAENATGPWRSIRESIDNTGRFQWRMPPEVPFRFYVRLSAEDRAGNVGRRITDQPVIVDLSRPKPKIIGVTPARAR